MKLTKTNHKSNDGNDIHLGTIYAGKWQGIVLLMGTSLEIYITTNSYKLTTYRSWKGYKEFQNFKLASQFALKMRRNYPSLRSIKNLGFKVFN